ncbi:hypothetical protein SLA2020_018380 [Shorea laevis]
MVRLFPVHSLPADGWRAQPQGLQTTTTVDLQTEKVSNGFTQAAAAPTFPLLCKRTHEDHSVGVFYGENPLEFSFDVIIFEIVFVITVTQILRILLRPLKQPRIVSEVIGGIIIGPSVLGRSKEFKKYIFPENANFVLKNVGIMGFMLYLFVNGLKMDLSLMKKSGKKQYGICILGITIPSIVACIVGFSIRSTMLDEQLSLSSSIMAFSGTASMTGFPVLYPILRELNLLSSEVGRLALAVALIGDVLGIGSIVIFEAVKQGEVETMNTIWYLISLAILLLFLFTAVKRVMVWIVKRTPEGEPVDQIYIIIILTGVFASAFLTDMFGIAVANGPFWLGLVIPDGPPLGATLVEKSETIVMELIMPFSFALVGLYTDVFAMAAGDWENLLPLFIITVAGWLAKFVVITTAGLLFNLTFKDSLALGLIMSLRGQIEFILYVHWLDKKIAKVDTYTMMVLVTTAMTAIVSPLITLLYDPTKPYMVHKRRTIQHTPPDTELRIVLCVHDQETLPGLINLLDYSHPTLNSPFTVFALHLIELIGRAAPIVIDHDQQKEPSKYGHYETIHNALKLYQNSKGELLKLHSYTAWTPKRTMYQDLCKLAMAKKAVLIILPFYKERVEDIASTTELTRGGVKSTNLNVLAHAPCSIGIFVDKAYLRNPLLARSFRGSLYSFVVLFMGGADAREALAYADRMVANPDVCLTVVRFLSYNNEGDNEMEKKLDDGVVTWFWVKNEGNERMVYREVVVKNGEETLAAIQAMNDGSCDLWVMGRKQGINPVLLEGLSDWSQNQEELGVLGDYIASADFGGSASVLVVQQQILRWQGPATHVSGDNFLQHLFSKCM